MQLQIHRLSAWDLGRMQRCGTEDPVPLHFLESLNTPHIDPEWGDRKRVAPG